MKSKTYQENYLCLIEVMAMFISLHSKQQMGKRQEKFVVTTMMRLSVSIYIIIKHLVYKVIKIIVWQRYLKDSAKGKFIVFDVTKVFDHIYYDDQQAKLSFNEFYLFLTHSSSIKLALYHSVLSQHVLTKNSLSTHSGPS